MIVPEGHDIGIMACADDCPVMAREVERAIEVAKEQGWLRPDGTWVWDDE